MLSLPGLLQSGSGHAWLFIPSAILLGALHGLEPGHSKTMMAAFIIAIRGTVAQAVLLGLSAALSHTAVVWVVALGGQYLGRNLNAASTKPYLQLASAAIIAGVAVWMILRTNRDLRPAAHDHDHHHSHDHDHQHAHARAEEIELVDAHERAHARDIDRRFAGRDATTGQIVVFGLTGGLIPCPAALTVLLLCLQLKRLTLGVVLVACFSLGLAATMVSVGVIASLGVRHMARHWPGFDRLTRRAPYVSAGLMLAISAYMGLSG